MKDRLDPLRGAPLPLAETELGKSPRRSPALLGLAALVTTAKSGA
ncbi:MAG TPA: hypothetical protein VIO60_02705 [Rectinemataceae bacterium]